MRSFISGILAFALVTGCGASENTKNTTVEPIVENTPNNNLPNNPNIETPPTSDCKEVPSGAFLGSMKLGEGFDIAGSAFIPEDTVAVSVMNDVFYSLNGKTGTVQKLGTWPSLCNPGTALMNVFPPRVVRTSAFLNAYLENDGTHLMSGYTLSDSGAPGEIALYNTQTQTTEWMKAPGNYTAVGVTGGFLINGMGLDSLVGEAGIYGLSTSKMPFQASVVASFDSTWAAASGFSALTSEGVAVLGHFSGNDFQNYLHAVTPTMQMGALETKNAFMLKEQTQVYAGGDLFRIAAFDKGIALHRGSYDMTTWVPKTTDISFLPLAVDGVKVTSGELKTLLTATDDMTEVTGLFSFGRDLLVSMKDETGTRLLRLRRQE